MSDTLVKRVRVERTLAEQKRLADAIDAWLKKRREADRDVEGLFGQKGAYLGFQKTRLATLESVFNGALKEVKEKLTPKDDAKHPGAIDLDKPPGEVYEQCRDYEETLVWLQRVWEYFRDKFDQRDSHDPEGAVAPFLQAADEVVWSCYRPTILRAAQRNPQLNILPAPLTYIEAQSSPAALMRDDRLPYGLRLTTDVKSAEFVAEFVQSLPVPVLALPPWCVEAPWWLVYVGHEIGHHVLHDLELTDEIAAAVKQAAPADANAWAVCSEEIFADFYSVLTMGPWAIWALVEAVWGPDVWMVERQTDLGYPAPAIRLLLMRETATRFGLDTTDALSRIELDRLIGTSDMAKADQTAVNGVLDSVQTVLENRLGGLKELYGLNENVYGRDGGTIDKYSKYLLTNPEKPALDRELETARHFVSAAVCAWMGIANNADDGGRLTKGKALAQAVSGALRCCAPAGTRPANPRVVPEKGQEFVTRLVSIRRERRRATEPAGDE